MNDEERYLNALHAMQSGVAYKMEFDPADTQPKHLRVGINSALVNSSALVNLLIKKGIITHEEYFKELADLMEEEVKNYEKTLGQKLAGPTIHLH